MLINNVDVSKIFLRHNNFAKASYTNSGGSAVTLKKGTLVGRITASGKVLPTAIAASDGSAQPIGVLADDYTVSAGGTVDVSYCFDGDVAEEKVVLSGAETLDSVVTGQGRLRDLLTRNTHITLVTKTELSKLDNQ